ncbi:glucosidase 2 subunit beta-like isoform X2 [Littorina saxatilis]|uniref:Glucosidase 2 subunit beta n=1 Tax=Littorina saxatilis TaxID=31220 RepID=A0AAN9B6P0_9CAEN
MFYKLLLILSLSFFAQAAERPRGVSSAKASFYQPGKDFKCLTSGETVPWEFVNDDYCDCKDGTDEPGTSACANGFFFCENRGHRGSYIISSRVNDGICDCCDGSDEFDEKIKCGNTCDEIGRKEREEREAFRQLQEQGYKIKQEYMQQGKRAKDEKRARLSELEKQMAELTAARDEIQTRKDEVEAPETEAKERHQKAWEELKAARQAEKDRVKAAHAFAELDANRDNVVDYPEMQKHLEFDIDSDGTVSVEEAREYLDDSDGVDLAKFQDKIWTNIKDIYKPPAEAQETKEALPDEDVATGSQDEEDRGEDSAKPKEAGEEEEKMPPYDEETQKLIEAADVVRKEYDEAADKVKDAENEVNGLKKYLEVDYGPDEEFSALRDQCFELTDREYTYKLCAFDKSSQRPKAGGIETSLGKWGHWYGPEEDKYDAMKYENGQSCWNGPSRSTHVNLHCGVENKLTGASEPSRCEYQFEFTTPARCKQPEPVTGQHQHTEL